MHIWHTLTRWLLAESVSRTEIIIFKQTVEIREEKNTWTARKTLRIPRSLALFHAWLSILEVAPRSICGFVTRVSRASQVQSGWREVWRNPNFFFL